MLIREWGDCWAFSFDHVRGVGRRYICPFKQKGDRRKRVEEMALLKDSPLALFPDGLSRVNVLGIIYKASNII